MCNRSKNEIVSEMRMVQIWGGVFLPSPSFFEGFHEWVKSDNWKKTPILTVSTKTTIKIQKYFACRIQAYFSLHFLLF